MSNAEDASIPNEEMDDGINENAAATNEEVTVNQEDNTIVQDVPVLEAFDGPFDFEVVGLQMISNGRQCCNHNVCDDHLGVGDVIKLVGTIVTNNDGRDEGALTVHKIIDGTVGCRVGFVPRVQATVLQRRFSQSEALHCADHFAIVKELYGESRNMYKQSRSKRNYGMACCIFISSITGYE